MKRIVALSLCCALGLTFAACGDGSSTDGSAGTTGTHEHEYTTEVTAPTCTERGYTTYTCDCGETYVDDYVNAAGHSYGSSHDLLMGQLKITKAVQNQCEKREIV